MGKPISEKRRAQISAQSRGNWNDPEIRGKIMAGVHRAATAKIAKNKKHARARPEPVPSSNPQAETLTGQIRGFCTSKQARAGLHQYGLSEKHIYMLGVGAETIDACIKTFRGRPGCLVLAEDLQIFGPSKKDVSDRADALEKADIRVIDLSHPEDQSYSALVRRAHNGISRNRFKTKELARRVGRSGGLSRGIAQWDKRNEIAPKWLIDKIVNHGRIPWRVKMDLLAPYFTAATLRRHYGINPTHGRREDAASA